MNEIQNNQEKISIIDVMQDERVLGNLKNCNDYDFILRILSLNRYPVQEKSIELNDFIDPWRYDEWLPCPKCGDIPKIWEFNNGKMTLCRCYETQYKHFSIHAESVASYFLRNNKTLKGYDHYSLLKEWNSYCQGETQKIFVPKFDENGKLLIW